jgi:hypothetical protein
MRNGIALVLLLIVRGLLLWIVLPVAALAWLVRLPYAFVRRRPVSIGQTLGWADLNLIASLERSLLRPLAREHSSFVRWHDAATVSHRPSLFDLA